MDDPILTNQFFRPILIRRRNEISGLCICKGSRLKTHKKSILEYLFILFFLLGPLKFLENSIRSISFKIDKLLNKLGDNQPSQSISKICKLLDIPVYEFDNPNDPHLLNIVKNIKPDIIINQTQHILQKELLKIPKIGIINRHNAILPRHKGRIAPFWALLSGDKQTGVSIHFVDEKIDQGPIIFQFRYNIGNCDFNDIVNINYRIAPLAMLKAIELISEESYSPTITDSKGNYNSTPQFEDLVRYLSIKYKSFVI